MIYSSAMDRVRLFRRWRKLVAMSKQYRIVQFRDKSMHHVVGLEKLMEDTKNGRWVMIRALPPWSFSDPADSRGFIVEENL